VMVGRWGKPPGSHNPGGVAPRPGWGGVGWGSGAGRPPRPRLPLAQPRARLLPPAAERTPATLSRFWHLGGDAAGPRQPPISVIPADRRRLMRETLERNPSHRRCVTYVVRQPHW
jgi:hypothetical protein